MQVNKVPVTYIILAFVSIGYFATDIYLPSLPSLTRYFETTESAVQLTLFAYMVSFSITPLFLGPLSDHIGRKGVMVPGLIVSIVATGLSLFSQSIEMLIAFRFIQGLGTSSVMIAARAMLPDYFHGRQLGEQLSLMTMWMPLILAVAPAIGGFLQESFGWRSTFLFLLVYMLLLFVVLLKLPESLKKPKEEPLTKVFSSYRELLANRPFILYSLGFVYPSVGLFAYVTSSPFLFQDVIGLSPREYGLLALICGAVVMTTSFVNSRLLRYYTPLPMLSFGAALMILSGSLLLLFHVLQVMTTWSLLFPALLFFATIPLNIANSGTSAMYQIKGNFGAANGLIATTQFLASSAGALVFSVIKEKDAFALAITYLLMGLLAAVTLFFAAKEAPTHRAQD